MQMSKKILAALLAVMMVLSLVPMTALAADQPTELATYKIARMGIAANKAAVPIDKENTGSWATNEDEGKYLYVELNKAAPAGYTIVVNVYPENKQEGVILSTYNATAGSKALAISFKRMAAWYYGEGSESNFNDKTSLYAQVSVVPVGQDGGAPAFTADENGKYIFTPVNSITKDGGIERAQLVELSTTPYVAPTAPAKLSAVATTGTVLGADMTNIQTGITAAEADANNVIVVTGTSKFAIWDGFSSVATQKYGNYVALDLTIPEGKSAFITSITEGNLVKVADNGDTLITNLGNYASKGYKCTVTVGTTKDEGGKQVLDVKDADYTLDFSKVVRSPMTIGSSVTIGDGTGDIKASYGNGKLILTGPVPFAGEETEATVENIKLTVSGVEKTVTATVTKGADGKLTAASVEVCGIDVPVDVSGMYVENGESTAVPAVSDPDIKAPEFTGEKQTLAETIATAMVDASTEVEEEILANAAAQKANSTTTAPQEALTDTQKANLATVTDGGSDLGKIQTAVAAGTADEFSTQGVNLVVKVYTAIAIKDVEPAEGAGAPETLTLSITPKAQTILTTADVESDPNAAIKVLADGAANKAEANAVLVKEEDVTISTPTVVKINLPATYTDGSYVIEHKKDNTSYYYEGTVSTQLLTFTSLHGFSDFVIYAENPCEAKIGEVLYETLAQAVAAVKEGETITLLKDIASDARIAVSGDSRNFVIVTGGKAFDPANITGATTESVNTPYTFIYTKSATNPSGPSGSGGGTSSGTPGTITTTSPANGTLTTNVSSAKEGDKVTVTVKPNEKYQVVTGITVKGENGNVTATKNADGTYSFTMPKGSVTVSASISHIYDLFTDVPKDIAEYGTAIKWAVEQGITLGTDPVGYTTFGPHSACTRAQMVVFLYRAAGSPAVTGTNAFTDVPKDAEIQKAVQWAVSKGITRGTSDTTFAPYDPCTRSQMVTFLHRNHSEPAATGTNNFADVPADAFYKTAVQWAVNEGVTKGTSDTTFAPNDACTRVQMVTFLYRDMGK